MWIDKLRKVLGKLWTALFRDHELVEGLLKVHGMHAASSERDMDKWLASMTASSYACRRTGMAYSIAIEAARIAPDGTRTERITYPEYDFDYCIEHGLDFTEGGVPRDENGGWCAKLPEGSPVPGMITEIFEGGSTLMLYGMDFRCENGWMIFKENPLGKPFRKLVEVLEDGTVVELVELVCRRFEEGPYSDLVGGLVDERLAGMPEYVWDMHVNGATMHTAKQLLASASNSVVSHSTGTVADVWTEGALTCIRISNGDLYVYSGDGQCVGVGAVVAPGDTLAGSLKVYDFKELPPADEVPAMLVRTDVGPLMAVNEDGVSTYNPSYDCKMLPLRDNDSTTVNEEYAALVASREADDRIPKVDLPDTLNPLGYVAQKVRTGRQLFVTLNEITDMVEPVLEVLRNSVCAGSIMTVYVKAAGDDAVVDLVQDFTSDIGMAAVASYATINARIGQAEAEIL